MKKILLIIFYTVFITIVAGAIYLLAFNNFPFVKNKEKPSSISLNQKILGIKPSKSYQFAFFIEPYNLHNQLVSYESSDENIVLINKVTGYMEAVKNGEATITVRVNDYPDVLDTCKVYVSNKDISIQSISIDKKSVDLDVGKSYQVKYSINPSSATIYELEFLSNNEDIVIINEKGIITANSIGKTTIKIYDKISNKSATMEINVRDVPKENQINNTPSQSDDNKQDNVNVNNEDNNYQDNNKSNNTIPSDSKVDDKSKNNVPNDSKVDDKTIDNHENNNGITQNDNSSNEVVEEIVLSPNDITLNVNETKQINISLYPNISRNISWSSSDISVVTVDKNGVIKAMKSGVASVTATVDNISKTVFVTVSEKENIVVNKKTFSAVFDGENMQSCTTEKDSCTIEAPNINKSGYEMLGWSNNNNSHESEIKVNEKIILTENKEYFSVTRKKITANFILQNNNATSKKESEFCYIYNNEISCKVTSPSLEGNNGYVALGWNTNKEASYAAIKSNEVISIKNNINYYSIIAKRSYLTATFKIQDASAIKESTKEVTCEITKGSSCEIKVPVLTVNSGYTLIGWNTDKSSITADLKSNDTISINSDITYFSITKKTNPLTASFVVQNNTATTTNNTASCELYNGSKSCKVKSSTLTATSGNEVLGWNTDKNANSSSLDGGKTISINKNVTYYSITRSMTPLTATFNITTPKLVSANTGSVSCNLYNGNKSCYIETPLLIKKLENVTPLGWDTDKSATKASIGNNYKIAISKNITYHSIVSQKITVTFVIGDNISGKNIKAEKLSFSYTDKNGKTVIREEGQSLKTTCTSYNGNGCAIKEIPTVHSLGNFVHGFSRTNGGNNMSVYKTTFKEDTTLYTRVGYYNAIEMKTINTKYIKMYGNVIFEVENGLSENQIASLRDVFDKIYKYYPELFYYNGKVSFLSRNTYMNNKIGTRDSAGITYKTTNYNDIYFYYHYKTASDYIGTAVHELGHAIDRMHFYMYGKDIIECSDVINLYNKYKNSSGRPLSSYAYTDIEEFVAEAFSATMRELLHEKDNKYYYARVGSLPDDIKNVMIKYINRERDFLVQRGIIK